MSQFIKLDIPESIMNLPIVCDADVQNQNNRLVDVQSIDLGSSYPFKPYYIGLVLSGKVDQNGKNVPSHEIGFAHILEYTALEAHAAYLANTRAAHVYYDSALEAQDQTTNRNLGTGVAGLLTAVFTAATVVKGRELMSTLYCQDQFVPVKTQALCVSDAYPEYRNELINDVSIGGAGIALFATIAYQLYKSGQKKLAETTLSFVKAASAQGNATVCANALEEYKTDKTFLPQPPQSP